MHSLSNQLSLSNETMHHSHQKPPKKVPNTISSINYVDFRVQI